jgi:transmembrane sensor
MTSVIEENEKTMITDHLLFRFLLHETSKKENRMIEEWLGKNPDHPTRLNQLREISDVPNQEAIPGETERTWKNMEALLLTGNQIARFKPNLTFSLASAAAVLLILACSGILWLFYNNAHVVRNKDLYTKTVILPDGTQVDLGPGSKLVYHDGFSNGIREVKLIGDAFFDVNSDPDHPFTVKAGLAKIKVTGTQFAVNAPPGNNEVQVAVRSGNVLFYNSENLSKKSFRMGLVAGEMGIFSPALNRMDKTRDPYFQTTP